MSAPNLERRVARDRRGGRPITLPDCAIDWALHQINDGHRSRRDVAEQLQIDRRTLDRRLREREGHGQGLLVRCHCGAITREACCANGHLIPLYLPQ